MIIFKTEFAEYFNKKIHTFLEAEIFYDDSGDTLNDHLDLFFQEHLIREQKDKCKEVMEDLFAWTGDRYWHAMTAFHEMGLYYFLEFVGDLRNDIPEFDSIYYDDEDKKEVQQLWDKFNINEMFEGSMKDVADLADFVHDIYGMQEFCLEDTDFLLLPDLSNNRIVGDTILEQLMGIDFDSYKELLPKDIRAQYERQPTSSLLFAEILKMLDFLLDRVTYRGLNKAFWQNNKPMREHDTQVLLDSLFAAYFRNNDLDISREVDIETGKIDFKFYRNQGEKVLIEVKLGDNPGLEKGVMSQLPFYMDALKYDDAVYLVICHSNKDAIRAQRLVDNSIFSRNIKPYIFDVSPKQVASKLK